MNFHEMTSIYLTSQAILNDTRSCLTLVFESVFTCYVRLYLANFSTIDIFFPPLGFFTNAPFFTTKLARPLEFVLKPLYEPDWALGDQSSSCVLTSFVLVLAFAPLLAFDPFAELLSMQLVHVMFFFLFERPAHVLLFLAAAQGSRR